MKILVVGPSWVGDMVMAQALFIALKKDHPKAVIDVLAPHWCNALLERMPQINQGIIMPVGHGQLGLGARWKLGRQLMREGYDWAIVLPNSFKSALIPFLAGIKKRTGWRGEMRHGLLNDLRQLNPKKYPLMVERFVALAGKASEPLPDPMPRPQLENDSAEVRWTLQKFDLKADKPILIICPGAEFGEAKRWPKQRFATVAQRKINQGWQVWIIGSAADQKVAEQISLQLSREADLHCVDLTGKTNLAEAVDLISLARAVVTNDSGLMHIAAALDRPLVSIYGSSSPDFTPPLNTQSRVVRTGIKCSPCFKRQCRYGHLKCLTEISAQQVLDELGSLLHSSTQ